MKRAHKSCGCGSAPDCVHPSESLKCGGVISIATEYQLLCHCSQSSFVLFLLNIFLFSCILYFLLLKQEIKVDRLLARKVRSVCCRQIASNLNSFGKLCNTREGSRVPSNVASCDILGVSLECFSVFISFFLPQMPRRQDASPCKMPSRARQHDAQLDKSRLLTR